MTCLKGVTLIIVRWKAQVPILDPGIHVKPGYAPYDSGIQQGVFMRDISGQPFVGQVRMDASARAILPAIPQRPCLHVSAQGTHALLDCRTAETEKVLRSKASYSGYPGDADNDSACPAPGCASSTDERAPGRCGRELSTFRTSRAPRR